MSAFRGRFAEARLFYSESYPRDELLVAPFLDKHIFFGLYVSD